MQSENARAYWMVGQSYLHSIDEKYLRQYEPDAWAHIDAERNAAARAKADAVYFDPYQQATGEFLEYVCGRPLNNPLAGVNI